MRRRPPPPLSLPAATPTADPAAVDYAEAVAKLEAAGWVEITTGRAADERQPRLEARNGAAGNLHVTAAAHGVDPAYLAEALIRAVPLA